MKTAKSANYYAAYEERYKIAHNNGVGWFSDICSPIAMETIEKYNIRKKQPILEIGCGGGGDPKAVLKNGYNLAAMNKRRSHSILKAENAKLS